MPSAEHTARFAKQIGVDLKSGDCLLLNGPVGAGKTHFARHLIWSLMPVPEDVPSPTFTLVQTYDTPEGEIWHADLYRLSGLDEIEELGLVDAFTTSICLIEWPELLGPLTPANALNLKFQPDPESESSRHITLQSSSDRWIPVLKSLSREFCA